MGKLTELELAMNAGARAIEQNKKLEGTYYCYDPFGDTQDIPYAEAARILRNTDAVSIVHGHYVIDEDGNTSCSVCGESGIDSSKNYCPNCGAKMEQKWMR